MIIIHNYHEVRAIVWFPPHIILYMISPFKLSINLGLILWAVLL
jgi:hypothetical protein